jgi:hypothetical protein
MGLTSVGGSRVYKRDTIDCTVAERDDDSYQPPRIGDGHHAARLSASG